jgi:hypothetical protein
MSWTGSLRGEAWFILTGSGVHGFIGSNFGISDLGSCGTAGRAILVSSSSRTESFTIAPQAKQIDKVGASSRLQTGQFITSPRPKF